MFLMVIAFIVMPLLESEVVFFEFSCRT